MKITIFGAGYVGLVTGTCLAEIGNEVCIVDVNPERIQQLKTGKSPIYEPGLDDMLMNNINAQRLTFTTDITKAVRFGILQFIAVGTPADEDGSADMRYVLSVAASIGKYLDQYAVVITKSTVPVGTADQVTQTIATELRNRSVNVSFDIASNPEFLAEGRAIEDFMHPSRIVVGADNETTLGLLRELYTPFIDQGTRFVGMNVASSELTKYACNAFLATRISFMNELSITAEHLGADIEQVKAGMKLDPRVGEYFLNAGCGYGGSCFPKDVKALQNTTKGHGTGSKVLSAVEAVNEAQKQILFKKLSKHFNGQLAGKKIAIWGLAFKPETDDLREAPSLVLLDALIKSQCHIHAYDPIAMPELTRVYPKHQRIHLSTDMYEATLDADALIIVTEWQQFIQADLNKVLTQMKGKLIIDGRNIYTLAAVSKFDVIYDSIGRSIHQS